MLINKPEKTTPYNDTNIDYPVNALLAPEFALLLCVEQTIVKLFLL